MFKLVVIGLVIIGKDPFALFGMQTPGIWEWGQGNKVRFAEDIIISKNLIFKYGPFLFAVGHNKASSGGHNHMA